MTIDFKKDLAMSESAVFEPYLQDVYHSLFPDLVAAVRLSGDTQGQRLGHDRILYLASGQTLFLDEKLDTTDCPNFAMEYVANDRASDIQHRRGWIEKPLQIDYILYAFVDFPRKAYLLPWSLLQLSWQRNKAAWLDTYGVRKIVNDHGSYTTLICPVPRKVILQAISNTMTVKETFR